MCGEHYNNIMLFIKGKEHNLSAAEVSTNSLTNNHKLKFTSSVHDGERESGRGESSLEGGAYPMACSIRTYPNHKLLV